MLVCFVFFLSHGNENKFLFWMMSELGYEVPSKRLICQRLGTQLEALLKGDWIMRTLTLSVDESIDDFILNGPLRSEAWLEEVGQGPLRVYHVPGPTQSLFLSLSLFWIP
jgi:hypothetical protein